jgi:hypothetical protein
MADSMAASVHQTENLLFFTLLQLIVMIGAARVMNTACRRVGQPGVVGEIVAGLVLGPSLFGYFFPQVSHALFGQRASTRDPLRTRDSGGCGRVSRIALAGDHRASSRHTL